MSVKSSTSYAQEDLDLINSEISNLEHSAPPSQSEGRTPKLSSENSGETGNPGATSSVESSNLQDSTNLVDTECKVVIPKEDIVRSTKDRSRFDKTYSNKDKARLKVNTVAMQLGIVEPGATMKSGTKDLAMKKELKGMKLSDEKEFDKSEELKPKILNRGGLKFFPGAKLEAKDFNEKWQVSANG